MERASATQAAKQVPIRIIPPDVTAPAKMRWVLKVKILADALDGSTKSSL
jgi:hypothetical protein